MIELFVTSQGLVRFLYDESLHMQELGPIRIQRASHVEPDAKGQWWADLTPSDGPTFGPFPQRTQAIDAECNWLTQHKLPSIPDQISESMPHASAPSSPSRSLPPVPETTSIQTPVSRSDLSGTGTARSL